MGVGSVQDLGSVSDTLESFFSSFFPFVVGPGPSDSGRFPPEELTRRSSDIGEHSLHDDVGRSVRSSV